MTTKEEQKLLRSKNPADYYFNVVVSEDTLISGTMVVICPKIYFDKEGCLYDQHIAKENGGPLRLPESLEELQEAMFLFDGTPDEAIAILTKLGLVHNAKLPV